MSEQVTFSKGLAGVIADESTICLINGEKGELNYRGYSIYDIAEHDATFDEVAYLLLHGELPNSEQLTAFTADLKARREVSEGVLAMIQGFPKDAHPMAALQTATAAMGMYDAVQGDDRAAQINRAMELIAKLPTVVAAFARSKKGQDVVAPNPELNHASNFLYMVNGEAPEEQAARTFEMALILHMEHSFNASTFTGRVVGSTMTTLYSAISAAVGALYGPLHGGANERTLEMVDEIASVEEADAYVLGKLERGEKIMGMGHRVYRAKDPRSVILEGMLADLAAKSGKGADYDKLKRVETVMRAEMEKKDKAIYPNVDFFSGALYRMLGIETEHFTPIFAIARVVGWAAHILELWEDNRIYRPRAHYTGKIGVAWTPISER